MVPPPTSGSAISSAVTYWLDTLPRTRAATGPAIVAGWDSSGPHPVIASPGGHPGHAELLERREHVTGVVRVQKLTHQRLAVSERGQQQHPVGDALRPGQAHGARHPPDGPKIEMFHGHVRSYA